MMERESVNINLLCACNNFYINVHINQKGLWGVKM